MYGLGIVKGMGVSMKRFFKKKVTQQYPEVKPDLPPRSHGSFGFDFDKCIACNMCADACPNGVIRVDFSKDEKGKRSLEQYNMSLGYCLFCGLCVNACPKDAVYFKTDFDTICFNKVDTIHVWKKKKPAELPVVEPAAASVTEASESLAEAAATKVVEPKAGQEGQGVR